MGLFIFVNVWTVSIHDGVSAYPIKWLNGAAHHTYHHKDFNYNYGQYFVFWDKWGGTLRDPYEPGRLLHKDFNTAAGGRRGAGASKTKAKAG